MEENMSFEPGHYVIHNTRPCWEFPDPIVCKFQLNRDGTGVQYDHKTGQPVYNCATPGEGLNFLEEWSVWHNGRLNVEKVSDL